MKPTPFDDEEIRAALEAHGIAHRPGLAAEMMDELGPLLAAEGINPGTFAGTPGQLQAALDRAAEQRNLALFTPVGQHRDGAISVLRLFAQARAEGDLDRAQQVLDAIAPDPTATHPSVAHVIGAGTGRLDEWSRRKDLQRIITSVRPQPWNAAAGKVARRLLELAGRGRAFDGLDEPIRKHGGLAVFEGTAVAVAAVVRAFAARGKKSVLEACDELLPGSDDLTLARTLNAVDDVVVEDFGTWLDDTDYLDPEERDAVIDDLTLVLQIARSIGLDPHDPEGIPDLLVELERLVAEQVDEDRQEEALATYNDALHRYVHFQMDLGDDPSAWAGVHTLVDDDEDVANELDSLAAELSRGPAGDTGLRLAASAAVPIVTAVRGLLDWLGDGRPATPSATARRADIATVAALLGIDAVGVDRNPRIPDEDPALDLADAPAASQQLRVMAMNDVRELRAWWWALVAAEVIVASPGRVRPGRLAESWRPGGRLIPFEEEILVTTFVAEYIAGPVPEPSSAPAYQQELLAAEQLAYSLVAAVSEEVGAHDESGFTEMIAQRTTRDMARLARLGIVEVTEDGAFRIPLGLQLAVIRGVSIAQRMLDDEADEGWDDDWDDEPFYLDDLEDEDLDDGDR